MIYSRTFPVSRDEFLAMHPSLLKGAYFHVEIRHGKLAEIVTYDEPVPERVSVEQPRVEAAAPATTRAPPRWTGLSCWSRSLQGWTQSPTRPRACTPGSWRRGGSGSAARWSTGRRPGLPIVELVAVGNGRPPLLRAESPAPGPVLPWKVGRGLSEGLRERLRVSGSKREPGSDPHGRALGAGP